MWPRGLRRRFAKPLCDVKSYRGFESLRLRQQICGWGSTMNNQSTINGILSIAEYLKMPGTEGYSNFLTCGKSDHEIIVNGMLKWNDETAHLWAGPFPGNYVHILAYRPKKLYHPGQVIYCSDLEKTLRNEPDFCPDAEKDTAKKIHDLIATKRTKQEDNTLANDAVYEAYLMILALPDNSILKRKITRRFSFEEDLNLYPSTLRPYRLHLSGNDDCSYSATFQTEEAMRAYIDELINLYAPYSDEYPSGFGMNFSN